MKLIGVKNVLEVSENKIEISPKGVLGFVEGNGNETILMKDVKSVAVRHCSFFNGGHITVTTNAMTRKIDFGGFAGRKQMNETADTMKTFILEKISNEPLNSF